MSARSTVDARLAAADLQKIDSICDQFEAEWRAGRRPDLAFYLSKTPFAREGCAFSRSAEPRPGISPRLERDARCAILPREVPRSGWCDRRRLHGRSQPRFLEAASRFERTERRLDHRVAACHAARNPFISLGRVYSGCAQEPGMPGYEIVGELGRGGMGVVFKAHQVALNRAVALKMIKSGSFATDGRATAISKRGRSCRTARPSSYRADLRGRPAPRTAFLQHEADCGKQSRQAPCRVCR